MAVEGITLNVGTGGDDLAVDSVGSYKYQIVKGAFGAAGSVTLITASSGLPVVNAGTMTVVLGAGTAAYGKLAANSGVDIGDVDVTSLPSDTFAAESSALGKGVLIQGDDGTDRTNLLVDTNGHAQVDVLSMTATNLDIRDLAAATDNVLIYANTAKDASGTSYVPLVDSDGHMQVDVLSVAAVDTELPSAAALADNAANPTVPAVGGFGMWYDGSTWDRARGDSTNGLLVNLGANNDVAQATTDNLNCNANVMQANADVATNNALYVQPGTGASFTVTASNLDIRDLAAATDNVLIYANTAKDGSGTNYVPLVDSDGHLQVDALSVSGVDTELPAAAQLADDASTPTAPAVGAFGMWHDGNSWDMARGDSTNGLLVNLGSNNDVVQATTDNLNCNANVMQANADVATDNALYVQPGTGASFTVAGTDLDIRDLAAATDSVLIYANTSKNGEGTDYVPLVDSDGHLQADVLSIAANSGTDIGDVDVTSVTPGTSATSLGKAVNDAATSTDVGVAALAVRDDSLSTLTPADGDFTHLRVDSKGYLHVALTDYARNLTQISDAAGEFLNITAAGQAEVYISGQGAAVEVQGDVAEDGNVGSSNPVLAGGRYDTTDRTLDNTDVGALAVDSESVLRTRLAVDAVQDGGTPQSPLRTVISCAALGNNVIVPAVSGKKTRVLSMGLHVRGELDCYFLETGGDPVYADSSNKVPLSNDGSDGAAGFILPPNLYGWMQTTSTSTSVSINLSTSVAVCGAAQYIGVD